MLNDFRASWQISPLVPLLLSGNRGAITMGMTSTSCCPHRGALSSLSSPERTSPTPVQLADWRDCWRWRSSRTILQSFRTCFLSLSPIRNFSDPIVPNWWVSSGRKVKNMARYNHYYTVGVIKNCTLVFVNFSAQGASILKISVPIIERRSWGFLNTPNLLNLIDFKPSYSNLKKMEDLQRLGSYSI